MSNYFSSLFGYLVRDKEAHEKFKNYYSKDQMDNDILKHYAPKEHIHYGYVSNEFDNEVTMTFSTIGEAQIVRRGKVVNIHAVMQFTGGSTTTMSNQLKLPDWAKPSEHCCYLSESSGVKIVHGGNVVDMNQVCTGYLQVVQQSNTCSFIHMNEDSVNGGWLYAELTYLVD